LRAPDVWKKTTYSEGSFGQGSFKNYKAETRSSSNAAEKGPEATSPLKNNGVNKRKAANVKLVYRRVEGPCLEAVREEENNRALVLFSDPAEGVPTAEEDGKEGERSAKKNKPTPPNSDNSAAAAMQPCPGQ
jgi:hypothetical protein